MNTNNKVSVGIRLSSMLLDHFIMSIISVLFFIPEIIKGIGNNFIISHVQSDGNLLNKPLLYLGLLGIGLYFCKDSINGQSIAKRITKLQVVDNITEQAASPIKCFVRNIFIIIWPIEVIVTFITPNRRIGDWVAGTKIVKYRQDIELQKINFRQVLASFVLASILLIFIFFVVDTLKPKSQKIHYIQNSYNEQESKSLEKICTDSIGQYVIPSFKVFDKIENNPNLKYISAIYQLKENFFQDENTFTELANASLRLIVLKLPENTFIGRSQYFYKEGNTFQKKEFNIGIAP